MARKRHSPKQVIASIREAKVGPAHGQTVAQVRKAVGVAEQTFF